MTAPLRPTYDPSRKPVERLAVGRSGGYSPSLIRIAANPPLDHRRDLLAPSAAVDDTVMADALPPQIFLLPGRPRFLQRQRRPGLADPINVAPLALDRPTRDIDDRVRIDRIASMLERPLGPQ